MKGKPVVILLVEDDPAHAEIVRRCLKDYLISNRMVHVDDGQMALDYLYRREEFRDPDRFPRPDLILLDLRLPKVDGLEVLETIKGDPGLCHIPVVVLTTSAAETDMLKAYQSHANSYLVKPVDFTKFMEQMKALGYFWLIWNEYPL